MGDDLYMCNVVGLDGWYRRQDGGVCEGHRTTGIASLQCYLESTSGIYWIVAVYVQIWKIGVLV